jgi:hypothetical protein
LRLGTKEIARSQTGFFAMDLTGQLSNLSGDLKELLSVA